MPRPEPPAIHPSHVMVAGKGFRVCDECDRCTCHRPRGLKQLCPAKEFNPHK